VNDEASLLVDKARALRPLIEREAARAEEETTTTQVVVDALTGAELFWILVPRELGGAEAGIEDALAVFEELAYADGSTGWSTMANATSSAFAAIYTGDDAAKTMFGPNGRGIHAGMFGPVGIARATDDGFVVSGKYQFGSGCAHATWIAAGTQEIDADGAPLNDESGLPALRVVFLRPEQAVMRGNWNVLGLAGTGSYDYTVDDEFVREEFSFPLLTATPRRGGPTYRIGLFGIVASGHAGFALGVGARALDEILAIARTKQRMGQFSPVADEQLFQHDYALHDAAMRSARAYVVDVFGKAEAEAVAGIGPSLVLQQRMRQATTYATRVAAEAARFAYTWAGTGALRGGVLQRCFRDIHAGTQHIYVDNNTLTAYAQVMLNS
jgi:alkylation response protein AidB-like acyl-CoA dehydrogenase